MLSNWIVEAVACSSDLSRRLFVVFTATVPSIRLPSMNTTGVAVVLAPVTVNVA